MYGSEVLKWIPQNEKRKIVSLCPVCNVSSPSEEILAMEDNASKENLTLYRCSECNSVFFKGLTAHSFLDYLDELLLSQYLQSNAGIDFMIRPIDRVNFPKDCSYLGVGCGVGFDLDFWRYKHPQSIVKGVEPAMWGRYGAKYLDLQIHEDLLQDVKSLDNCKFDVIFSSEVIEHTPNPKEYILLLCNYLKDDGILILTTPAADFVKLEHADTLEVIENVGAGFHYYNLSLTALKDLLVASGLTENHIEIQKHRLISWSSKKSFMLNKWEPNNYLEYLTERQMTVENPDVKLGLLFRELKERINSGVFDRKMEKCLGNLFNLLGMRYDITLSNLVQFSDKILALGGKCDKKILAEISPCFFPQLLFYYSFYVKHHGNKARAIVLFQHAVKLCDFFQNVFGSLVNLEINGIKLAAIYESALVLYESNRISEAIEIYKKIIDPNVTSLTINSSYDKSLVLKSYVELVKHYDFNREVFPDDLSQALNDFILKKYKVAINVSLNEVVLHDLCRAEQIAFTWLWKSLGAIELNSNANYQLAQSYFKNSLQLLSTIEDKGSLLGLEQDCIDMYWIAVLNNAHDSYEADKENGLNLFFDIINHREMKEGGEPHGFSVCPDLILLKSYLEIFKHYVYFDFHPEPYIAMEILNGALMFINEKYNVNLMEGTHFSMERLTQDTILSLCSLFKAIGAVCLNRLNKFSLAYNSFCMVKMMSQSLSIKNRFAIRKSVIECKKLKKEAHIRLFTCYN